LTNRYLTVDAGSYSTGVRDPHTGEHLTLKTLPVTADFRQRFASWLQRYQEANFRSGEVALEPYSYALDEEGLRLAKELKALVGGAAKITYYSDAFCTSFLT
jgi:hypothetical protein